MSGRLSEKRKKLDSESTEETLPPEIEDSCVKFFRQLVALEKVLQYVNQLMIPSYCYTIELPLLSVLNDICIYF